MKYTNKEKIIKEAERSSVQLGVQKLIFEDDTFVTTGAILPGFLEEGEHLLEVVYYGDVQYFEDELTDAAFERVDAFVINYIENILRKPVIRVDFE